MKGVFQSVRKESLPYMLLWCAYYGFAMLFATQFAFFDVTTLGKTGNLYFTVSHICLLPAVFIASYVVKRDKLVRLGRVVGAMLALLMIVLCCVPSIRYNIAVAVVAGVMFGFICYEVLTQFCFALNRAERLITIAVSNTILCLLGLVPAFTTRGSTAFYVVETVFCVLTLVIQFFCKEQPMRIPVAAENQPIHRELRLTLTVLLGLAGSVFSTGAVIFVSNITIEKVGSDLLYLFYVGGIAASIFFFIVNSFTKSRLSLNVNLTFAATIIGLAASLGVAERALAIVSMLFCGASFTLGMLCVYTGTALIAEEYYSMKYVRAMVAVVGIFGGVGAPLVAGLIIRNGAVNDTFSIVMIAATSVILLLTLVFSPYMSKKIDEIPKVETLPEIPVNKSNNLDGHNLTAREKEVAELLLQGKTMRQISGELNISQSTVNTYCTSIYRKCNVNSRTELILLLR